MKRLKRASMAVLAVFALSLSGCARAGGPGPSEGWHGSLFEPPIPATDFTLARADGGTFRLKDQRGRAVLLFFGSTSCPEICPTELGTWRRVRALLGPEAERVRFVFITVDPERDTPERVTKFLCSAGDPSFVGLTGTRDQLKAVWADYSVSVQREKPEKPGGFYSVSHSALTYLVTPDGVLW